MIFQPTQLPGVWVVDIEPHMDERGFFARGWCQREFAAQGLDPACVQTNLAYSKKRGTLRGLHYQTAPDGEVKLVRCTRGAAYVVAVDLRADQCTHRNWVAVELSQDNRRMLYVGLGFAQGYQTLADDTEMLYQMSAFYAPESASGVRYNDPAFEIQWPLANPVMSEKDRNWPDYCWDQPT
jgi:dTDP-4-dehydrorhamnose 3,5-epimerase